MDVPTSNAWQLLALSDLMGQSTAFFRLTDAYFESTEVVISRAPDQWHSESNVKLNKVALLNI